MVALMTLLSPPQPALDELNALPKKSEIPWFTIILAVFLLGGFAWGFWQGGLEVGGELVLQWALITAAGGALGCLAAGGHPLSILAAAVSSPLTPLHPALASGTVSAVVEAWVRKPTYADFLRLRDDTAHVSGWWKNRAKWRKRAEELLKKVGLSHRLKHKPRELSGGEMQRAAVARALLMNPRVLLADEPTGNLDADTGNEIVRLLRELNREEGVTIVMVTHNLDIVAATDRVVRMVNGVVTEDSTKPPFRHQPHLMAV